MTAKLTPKQDHFARVYVETGNASEAYRQAYDVGENTKPASIWVGASKVLANNKVKDGVSKLRQSIYDRHIERGSVSDIIAAIMLVENIENPVGKFVEWATLEIRRTGKEAPIKKYQILERAGFRCQACGASPNKTNAVVLNVDHIVPKSIGGGDEPSNLQCLCFSCNISKSNRSVYNHNEEWFDG